jgi:N-methylhydantoinase B
MQTSQRGIDPITLEIWWSRLVAIADEAAVTLVRTSFSTIIRESNDYSVVLLNRAGETIAECRAGVPGFAAIMGVIARNVLGKFPLAEWQEGDCVITNHPWLATGHLPDVAMVVPIFHRGVLVGFSGTVAHVPDIGGTPSMGVTELISEGLLIPPVRMCRAGKRNGDLLDLFFSNVRLADQVRGDLEAQLTANAVCRRRAIEFLQETRQDNFEALSAAVHEEAEHVMRHAISAIPDGVYTSTVLADGVEGQPTRIECAITVDGDAMAVDYTGSSPQVQHAVNCTLNYTRAYTVYPIKILLDPFTRRNEGSYKPISVTAAQGSILNPIFPAPVIARHLTGHLLSCAVYQALASVLPQKIIADSGGSPALRVQFSGRLSQGEPFALLFFASAGMGATPHADGLSTTAFPSNTGGASVEVLESEAPLLFAKKEYRADSGGAGRHRGGLGQDIEVQNISSSTIRTVLVGDREQHPAMGVMGGKPGAAAQVVFDHGPRPSLKSVTPLPPGAKVMLSFAGGGGYGPAQERDHEAIASDLAEGYVTYEGAVRDYGADAVRGAGGRR